MYYVRALTAIGTSSSSFGRSWKRKSLVACKLMWQNMRAYRTNTNNPCPYINAELLLVSRMDCTKRILLCPLVLVVNIDDGISISVKSTDETNKCSALH
jgi:hypothetical protein